MHDESGQTGEIISAYFEKWTAGLSDREKRVAIFEKIREIPYALVPGLIDAERGPAGLLTLMKGSCSPRHFLLGSMFERLALPVRYVTIPFSWNIPALLYPPEVRALTLNTPLECHVACRAFIGEKWILIDATWPLCLKPHGFPVNETWDGESDTKPAVPASREIVHQSAEKCVDYQKKEQESLGAEERLKMTQLYGALNKWLVSLQNLPCIEPAP